MEEGDEGRVARLTHRRGLSHEEKVPPPPYGGGGVSVRGNKHQKEKRKERRALT